MRVWDIPVNELCTKHLVAQHFEIHCIYNVITQKRKGWSKHPEVNRWRGKIDSLTRVHLDTVVEMKKRGLKHNSPLPVCDLISDYPEPWQPIELQREILKEKHGA